MSISVAAHRTIHRGLVGSRRIQALTQVLHELVPPNATILDVGCGNGIISYNLGQLSAGRDYTGIDVLARSSCQIPCQIYDGERIPFDSGSFDYVQFVDVLHHTTDPAKLLVQAASVARKGLFIKDHYSQNGFDHAVLTLMDWFGNAQDGVALPNTYLSREEWQRYLDQAKVRAAVLKTDIALYPFPANLVFGRGLHFAGRFEKLA